MTAAQFTVIPAVDIRGGRCVRLFRGLPEKETVFSEDPVRVARRWQDEGASLLHVVDLDGAFKGSPVNEDVVLRIAGELSIPVEVGGGIRTLDSALVYLEGGVSRVIIGTAAFGAPGLLEELSAELGERLAVGVDVRDGRVALAGWTETGDMGPVEAVSMLGEAGVRRVVYTDTARDGTLSGPNFQGIEEVARASTAPVIASGGVGSLSDVERIAAMSGLGIEGVIIGMALYRGGFTLPEAQRTAERGAA